MLLTVAFLAFSLPPYLSFDPARSRVPVLLHYPWYYPMLVAHILFGSVALLTACLQVWPWLRRRYPAAHRLSGRLYVFAGALPASLAVLTVAPFGTWGANQRTANTMLALLWLATTLAGYRAARQRRFADHREWMIRSVALAFSIVANRAWSIVCILVFAPGALTQDGDIVASPEVAQAIGVSTWLSWVVNLLVAEWWLNRTRTRRRARAPQSAPPASPLSAELVAAGCPPSAEDVEFPQSSQQNVTSSPNRRDQPHSDSETSAEGMRSSRRRMLRALSVRR
jgi:Predicted membrane protein (DUF2306)